MPENFLFVIAVAWLFGLVRLLFSKTLAWVWKLSALLLFFFYLIFYRQMLVGKFEALLDRPEETLTGLVLTVVSAMPLLRCRPLWPTGKSVLFCCLLSFTGSSGLRAIRQAQNRSTGYKRP